MATSKTYARCRNCNWHRDDGASLSKRGLCPKCGRELKDAAADDLRHHRGPYFRNWRRGMAASVGAVLLDADAPNE